MSGDWQPSERGTRIETLELHTAGEPLRVILSGLPEIRGATILEKRRFMREHLDDVRTALMFEPRGHADMYGCILTEPVTPGADLGVLFLHNEGYSTMCGHAIIALTKAALDTALVKKEGDRPVLVLDTPAGQVTATARRVDGRVRDVSFHNVPSFVLALDQVAHVPGLGDVPYDLAYGGAFYAICQARDADVGLGIEDFRRLIDVGMRIKHAVMEQAEIRHPFEEDLSFLYGTILVGEPREPSHHSRNVCVFADGEVDRSPTGTGVSARAALHFARGEIQQGEQFMVESILGTCMIGRVVETTTFGPHQAVIPEVTGRAWITGRSEWWIDPEDPLHRGVLLR